MPENGKGHGLVEGDQIIQVIDNTLIYVEDLEGNQFRIDYYYYLNGSGNIVQEYDRKGRQ